MQDGSDRGQNQGQELISGTSATSFAYKVVFRCDLPDTPKFGNVKVFHSENPAKELLDALEEIEPELIEFLTREERMEMTPGDVDHFEYAKECYICQ